MSGSRTIGSGLALMLAFAAGCSEPGALAPSETAGPSFQQFGSLAVPVPADVILPGVTVGSFGGFTANNSGRATTEFWDNFSTDIVAPGTSCNVGFFATGTLNSNCLNPSQGSFNNQVGNAYTQYWGDGVGGRSPSSFMFNGDFQYNVVLQGIFAEANSEIGYFTKSGGVYTFTPVPNWGARILDENVTINTGGLDWGFYIKNGLIGGGGCAPQTACSDTEGGFAGSPFQQFALFLNSTTNTYLVGTEDNVLGLWTPGTAVGPDSDYNDFMFSVEPIEVEVLQGRMTGGGGKLVEVGGGDVTYGLTLHCDITLSNNLEINWPGNKWHLDKPITFADCQDNNPTPEPPRAPFDTFIGEGLGKLNGVAGSRVEFTFIDDGEGPTSNDQAQIKVFAPGGALVLNVLLQSAAKGNIQAHYDQPHGQKP